MIIEHANRHVTWVLTEVIGNLGVADIDSRLEVHVPGMNHGVQEWKESSGDAIFVRTVDMVNIMMFLESVYMGARCTFLAPPPPWYGPPQYLQQQ